MRKKVSKAKGITAKLVSAIVISVVLAVSALLVVVYSRVSDAFLTKSEELLQATTGKTIQETSAWMNRTLTMLGETVGSIDEGTRAAQETSESMLAVVTHADEMSGLIDSIAENTSRQAEGAAEIAHGIEQISSVVDSNADNAQRSAAASEELSGQAEMLKTWWLPLK